jgi:predicted ATP-grasp superfamily ATP-dependent carboligase
MHDLAVAYVEDRNEEHDLPMKVLVHEYVSGGGTLGGIAPGEAAALLAQGRAMRDAMVRDLRALPGVQVNVCDTMADWPGAVRHADAVWSVAPETGGVLAALCESVPPPKWLGCTPRAIRIAGSKSATRELLAGAGIAVPSTPGGAGRFVVKPDDGAGAVDTRVFDSFAAAAQALRAGMTIESFVDGEPLSVSLLCARGSAELLSVNRQRIRIGAEGALAFGGVDVAVEPADGARGRALQALAADVARALPGLHGFVGIDLVWHDRRGAVVIEINPRLTTAYVGLSARLGRNIARDLVALLA